MNPIINQMFSQNSILNMFKSVRSAKNPGALLLSLAQNNSQLGQVLDYIKQNGGNAEQLYYNTAKQMNRDPNIIINQLKNM